MKRWASGKSSSKCRLQPFIAKVTAAAVIAGLIAVLTLVAFEDLLPAAAAGVVAAALGGIGYLGIARLFAIHEVGDVVDRVRRRFGRR